MCTLMVAPIWYMGSSFGVRGAVSFNLLLIVLGIKPLITLKEGEIFPSGITRSRRKSMEKVIDLDRNPGAGEGL